MKVLSVTICLFAAVLAADIEGGPALIEPFSQHLHDGVSSAAAEKRGSSPYQVALTDEAGNPLCSGVIISDEWVLTAGHCVDQNRGNIVVHAGIVKLDARNGQTVTTTAADRKLHKAFNIDFLDNDIALIKLPTKLTIDGTWIKPVTLPTYADAAAGLAGKKAYIAGWGKAAAGQQGSSLALKFAEITLTENTSCEQLYGNVVIGTKACIATADTPDSVCTGDSGTPVVERDYPINTLHGILSFGSKDGCAAKKPVVFTRITSFLNFIEETTGIKIEDNPPVDE